MDSSEQINTSQQFKKKDLLRVKIPSQQELPQTNQVNTSPKNMQQTVTSPCIPSINPCASPCVPCVSPCVPSPCCGSSTVDLGPNKYAGHQICEYRLCDREKDSLIDQLNRRIQELEQKEHGYDGLNQKFKQLENDYTLLNEAKLRLEYELKQKDEAFTKRICDLNGDNECLKTYYNEKNITNKKLIDEKALLENTLSQRNCDIANLSAHINDLTNKINQTVIDNDSLEKMVDGLNQFRTDQKNEVTKLVEDNQKLSGICQDQVNQLRLGEQDKQNLLRQLDESNNNLKNLTDMVRSHANNLADITRQLNQAKECNKGLKNKVNDCARQFEEYKDENEKLKREFSEEKNNRINSDKINEQLNAALRGGERVLDKLEQDYNDLARLQERTLKVRERTQMINDNLRNHIMFLTDQNQALIGEIDNAVNIDGKMRGILNRRDRTSNILIDNKKNIENSALSNFNSKCPCNEMSSTFYRTYSPYLCHSPI